MLVLTSILILTYFPEAQGTPQINGVSSDMATVWDTDIKQNNTIADRSGLYALEFMANRTGIVESAYRPVDVGMPYRFTARMRTSLNGANDTVEVTARWYTNAQVFISANNVHASAVLSAANVWDTLTGIFDAPATAAFATIRVEKDDTTTAYIAYCDFAEVAPHPITSRAYLSATQSVASAGSPHQIEYDTETYDYGSAFDTANYRFVAPSYGLYDISLLFHAYTIAAPDAGMYWTVSLYKNGGLHYSIMGGSDNDVMPTNIWYGSWSEPLPLARGDYIEIFLTHNNTANMFVTTTGRFSVAMVGGN
jgi:hypothetical protein